MINTTIKRFKENLDVVNAFPYRIHRFDLEYPLKEKGGALAEFFILLAEGYRDQCGSQASKRDFNETIGEKVFESYFSQASDRKTQPKTGGLRLYLVNYRPGENKGAPVGFALVSSPRVPRAYRNSKQETLISKKLDGGGPITWAALVNENGEAYDNNKLVDLIAICGKGFAPLLLNQILDDYPGKDISLDVTGGRQDVKGRENWDIQVGSLSKEGPGKTLRDQLQRDVLPGANNQSLVEQYRKRGFQPIAAVTYNTPPAALTSARRYNYYTARELGNNLSFAMVGNRKDVYSKIQGLKLPDPPAGIAQKLTSLKKQELPPSVADVKALMANLDALKKQSQNDNKALQQLKTALDKEDKAVQKQEKAKTPEQKAEAKKEEKQAQKEQEKALAKLTAEAPPVQKKIRLSAEREERRLAKEKVETKRLSRELKALEAEDQRSRLAREQRAAKKRQDAANKRREDARLRSRQREQEAASRLAAEQAEAAEKSRKSRERRAREEAAEKSRKSTERRQRAEAEKEAARLLELEKAARELRAAQLAAEKKAERLEAQRQAELDRQQAIIELEQAESDSEDASVPAPGAAAAAVPQGKRKGRRGGKKKRVESYSTYIYKVLKQVHPDTGMTRRSMSIMNSFVNDMFERLASEAGRLARYTKKKTLSSREISTAVQLVLPGELAKHAVSEGTKAVTKYTSSRS